MYYDGKLKLSEEAIEPRYRSNTFAYVGNPDTNKNQTSTHYSFYPISSKKHHFHLLAIVFLINNLQFAIRELIYFLYICFHKTVKNEKAQWYAPS